MILGIIIGIFIGTLVTILASFLLNQYIKSGCEDWERWVKYLKEMENEQKDNNPDIE